ncbi:MAG: type II toxin-antitoxin system VapB family antitoxin [Deltaproteobacteria bacterium]|nr:type II toxin-antitoxin system VapB family antitoxin [Deltaproteobacteria bacterium]
MTTSKTTLNIRDDLLQEAAEATGVKEKTALIHLGLEALIKKAARERLAKLGGSLRSASAAPRRRSA